MHFAGQSGVLALIRLPLGCGRVATRFLKTGFKYVMKKPIIKMYKPYFYAKYYMLNILCI